MSAPELIRIVSRDSPMALAQVERVRAELGALHPGIATEVIPVKTTGDRWMGALSQVEGKGAFTKEVDAALLAGEADLAVHCVKDIPGDRPLPAGTTFAAFLERDDVRDALIHPGGLTLDQLPDGTRIGTSSVRRVAQLAASHPHLQCVPMRGNANRRMEKLAAGEADALLLAVSGLERIGRTDVITQILSVDEMCPPIGAGVLALQCREGDTETIDAVSGLGHPGPSRRPPPNACCCTFCRVTATARSPATPRPTIAANCRCGPVCSPRTARRCSTRTNGPVRSPRRRSARPWPSPCCGRVRAS